MIITYPNDILTTPTEEVTVFDKELRLLVADLKKHMKEYNGIGIAANQIGSNKRVAIVVPGLTLVNPKIFRTFGDIELSEESCLSLPYLKGSVMVARHSRIIVQYQDVRGNLKNKEFIGLRAIIIQHEIDHLNGITLIEKGNITF